MNPQKQLWRCTRGVRHSVAGGFDVQPLPGV